MLHVSLLAEHFFSREANGIHTALLQLMEWFKFHDRVSLSYNDISADTDVIHAHTVGPRYLWYSLRHRHKLIVTAHISPNICQGAIFARLCVFLSKKYLRLAYNRARLVIAVSPIVARELRSIGVVSDIEVICNSTDRKKFKPNAELKTKLRNELKLSVDDFVVLGVGQIQPRKGIKHFIAVAERLPHLQFLWVGGRPFGKFTADYEALTHLIEDPPTNVTFVGAVPYDEMPGYYALADAFLFPSHHECFAYVILEAGATHLPLVLWDNAEYLEYLFGHYLKARDEEGLAELLNRLYEDEAFRRRWQDEAFQLANHYESEHFIEQLTQKYQLVATD